MTTTVSSTPAPELRLVLTDEAPLESAGAAVRACAQGNGFEAERATRLQVMVEELLRESRLREESNGSGDLEVSVDFDGANLQVTVTDHRLPLSPAQSRHLPSRRLLALGFVDRLHVGFEGSIGNVATCQLHLDSDRTDDHLHVAMLEPDVPDVPDAEAAQIDVRLMNPDDAVGLVQCVFRCYGYTYPNPSMYQAKSIRRQLASGAMLSVVAVTPEGDIVGHVACTFEFAGDPVPEGGKMIVDPRFRGHHLAERLSLARAEMAKDHGIPGVWAEAVTNHPASQRLAIQRGAAEVGLLIGVGPQGMLMNGLPNVEDVRPSLIAVFTPISKQGSAVLSIPAHASEHVQTLTERLGIERSLDTAVVPPARERSHFRTTASALAGGLEIRVHELGLDIAERMADTLDEYLAMVPSYVHLHLPATDPSAAWAVIQLERMGFAWCAWIPDYLASGDSIRLQKVTDQPVDPHQIVCARPEGVSVRDFVVSEWTRVRHGNLTVGAT